MLSSISQSVLLREAVRTRWIRLSMFFNWASKSPRRTMSSIGAGIEVDQVLPALRRLVLRREAKAKAFQHLANVECLVDFLGR